MESNCESVLNLIEQKKGRKRLQYVELRKKRKAKKDSGKAYETYSGELKKNKKRLDHLLRVTELFAALRSYLETKENVSFMIWNKLKSLRSPMCLKVSSTIYLTTVKSVKSPS